jgi:hypothetical protein
MAPRSQSNTQTSAGFDENGNLIEVDVDGNQVGDIQEYNQTGVTVNEDLQELIETEQRKPIAKTLWYPMQNIGNRPDIDGKDENGNNKPSCDLEKYGAFHFEIYYFPEKKFKDGKETDEKNTGDINVQYTKGITTEEGNKYFKDMKVEFDKTGMYGTAATITETIVSMGQFVGTSSILTITKGFEMGYDAFKVMTNPDIRQDENSRVISAPMLAYKGRQSDKFDIYLPLRNYQINRNSGVAENKDVISDLGTKMTKNIYNKLTNSTFGGGIFSMAAIQPGDALKTAESALGTTIRDFVAPRVNSPSLETLDLTWDLIPRSQEEMGMIINILKCFQYLSIPSFNKDDLFYVMPPVMQMEAITKDFTTGQIRNLRPKKQYYITNLNINFSTNESGEVLLTPDGFPMFINLKISLLKAELANAEELYNNPFM